MSAGRITAASSSKKVSFWLACLDMIDAGQLFHCRTKSPNHPKETMPNVR
jgi:hypothetical protein